MSINRRTFLKKSVYAGGAIMASSMVPVNLIASTQTDYLTILHTNDVHSRLDPFPMDGSKNAGMGGVAARAALIEKIRKEVPNVLLVDAGDMFQGTPYFNVYKGEPEIKAMSIMGYDAGTMGNHDFDGGLENLARQLHHANFPVIICNYDFSGTAMENKSVPYKIFKKGNLKVGVLGVGIELAGLVSDNLYEKTVYQSPVEKANETAAHLKKQGCDMIICLSHLGDRYDDKKVSDEVLATECYDIDLIIGGHTHRFFNAPKVYRNKKGNDTVVNQVGWGGIELGRLDYGFVRAGKKNLIKSHTVLVSEKKS